MKHLISLILCITLAIGIATAQSNIVPEPQTMTLTGGTTAVNSSNTIYYDNAAFADIANLLRDEIFRCHGITLSVAAGASAGAGDILIKTNAGLNGERYLLNINGSITVEASGINGAYPGTVSAVQAIASAGGGSGTAPNLSIDDSPFREFRSVMIDVKNYWYSPDDIKTFIKMARFYKVRYLSLHTGEKQWLGAVLDQTTNFTAAQRAAHHLYTKAEMDDLIQFGKQHGVYLFPHNESASHHGHMKDAMQLDFNPNDSYAGYADEIDGQGSFAGFTGDESDARFRSVVSEAHRRAIDQFKAGYPAGMNMPMYHVGPVVSEGGMSENLADYFRSVIVGYDSNIKMSYWATPSVSGPLAANKNQLIPICYTKQFHATYANFLQNDWTIANAAWTPLYIVGSSIARPVDMVYNEWNYFRGGTDGIVGAIEYDEFAGINDNNLFGGLLATWENTSSINLALLKLRLPAFAEHAWHHKSWPYPANDFTDYSDRMTVTQPLAELFISNGLPPNAPQTVAATDGLFPDNIRVTWTAATNGPITYTLYRNTSNSTAGATIIATFSSDQTVYEDTNVSNGTTYYYWVKAQNNSGESGFSPSNTGSAGNGGGLVNAYEPFDYTVGQNVDEKNGGNGWSDSWSIVSTNGTASINNYGLTYPGLQTNGNSLRIEPSTETPSLNIERNTSGQIGAEGTSTWISFLLKINTLRNGHLAIIPNNAFNLGLIKRWGSKLLNTTAVEGETYFVVMQVENVPGVDFHRTWLNPAIGIIPSPSNTSTINDNVDLGTGNKITINLQGYGQGQYDIDEIRVGTSYLEVMPSNAACPGGEFIGTTCDDNDPCTANDVIDNNCNCTGTFSDADNDGVCDSNDICPAGDDNIDTDNNGTPDACDAGACAKQALDNFSYTPNTSIDGANGGLGFSNAWSIPNPMNGSIEVLSGSLDFSGNSSAGNKVRFTLQGEDATKSIRRDLVQPFQNGEEVWITCLIKPIVRADGGFWIKPNDRQDIAIGKRWGSQLAIDNNSSSTNVQENVVSKLVVRYKLEAAQTVAHLWIDRNDNFTDANADANKTIGAISDINNLTISIERWGDGVMEIDELYIGCSAESNPECTTGATCDDGNVCTTGDVYDANCNCTGVFQDADNDGTCDANDNTNGDCTLGALCDDSDACTLGEYYDADCNCVNDTVSPDSDNDGICDANDECPNDSTNTCNDTTDDCSNLLPQQAVPVLGEGKMLIIRGVDPATHTWTDTDNHLNNFVVQLDQYIKNTSFNKAWISSEMTPVYNFTVDPNSNGPGPMSSQLRTLATNDGYDIDSYNIISYIHESTTDFYGAGALGSGSNFNGVLYSNNSLSWYYKGNIHEVFHTISVGHAETIEGGDAIYPGNVTGGHDPYHFMGSEGDGGLNSDIPSYMKYFLGWINPSEIRCVPTVTDTCITRRIYEYALVSTYNNQHDYGIQLKENLWLSYEPENANTRIEKNGVLFHYIPGPGSEVSRLLDVNPNTITEVPSGVSSSYQPVVDFWDAAMVAGDVVNYDGVDISIAATGGTGETRWVDIQLCDCLAVSGDDDNDGVCNDLDMCAGNDDNLDMDDDDIPDACDACPEAATNDSNNDGICDNLQCLKQAHEDFAYSLSMDIDSADGGMGLMNNWEQITPDNGVIEFTTGSLSYPDITSNGEKLHINIDNEITNTVAILRDFENPYNNRDEFWMSILVKANTIGSGGVWIKPGNRQDIAIGKRWGTQFAINNEGSPKYMQANKTYWLVAKYELKTTETIAKLWVDPDPATFDENSPDATRTVGYINEINSVSIAIERYGLGDYEFDELQFSCDAPYPLNCVDVQLHALLEGAYDSTTNVMSTTLQSRGLLPGQTPVSNLATATPARQPYSNAPWNYAGTEGLTWTDTNYNGTETDWILASFRTGIPKGTEVSQSAGILHQNGNITFPDRCPVPNTLSDSLYVVLEHRNHIGVMTPYAIPIIGNTLTYDFRLSDSYRDVTSIGQKQLSPSQWCLFAGDADQFDFPSFDINGTDKAIWFNNNGVFDYYTSPDFNLDGDINGADKSLWFGNNGISSRVPK